MQRPPPNNGALGAKRRIEIRPYYGMPLGTPASRTPALGALVGLGVIWAISGYFNVKYDNCHFTCETDEDCPGSLKCVDNGTGLPLCAQAGTLTCAPNNTDAGADDGGLDAGGNDGADAMDGGDGGDGPDTGGPPVPPEVLCHNGSCFPLPPAVRANLVLLLWPSNLPPVGSPVDVWRDQSGHDNHAVALFPTAPPHVIANGVQLDASQRGSGFVVANSPSLDFGSGDFAIIVVAGLASGTTPVSFFRKSDGLRENSRQISLEWVRSASNEGQLQAAVNDTPVVATRDVRQPSVGAYALRRMTDYLELRVNEAVLGSADLPAAGMSTTNAQHVYLGVANMLGNPAESIEAVIAIRGAIDSAHLEELLAFLRASFAITPSI
jgi:hypothetical protein